MVAVLSFVNSLSPASIPCEIAAEIERKTEADVTVAAFYKSDDHKDISESLARSGVDVRPLAATSRFDLSAFHRLRQILYFEDIDVLHTHHNFSGVLARIIAQGTGVAVATTEHRSHESMSVIQNVVNVPTLPLADWLVFNSKSTRRSLYPIERLLLAAVDKEVIHNGVDVDRIDAAMSEIREHDSPPQIVCVGRLVPVKNHETLLVAFEKIKDRIPEAELTLVGDGPLREKLELRTLDLGISDAVTFTGDISRESVYRHLAVADVFALASRSEGFCVAAVEAMAAGVPVIVSDIPVFHEVVAECGSYAEPDNPASFAKVIGSHLSNEERRNQLSAAARNRALSQFSLERTANEYYKMYRKLSSRNTA